MAVFPAVRAKEDRCENPASATLRVFGIVGYRDQLAELAAGLAAGEKEGGRGPRGRVPAFLLARVFAMTPLAWLLCPRAFGLRRSGAGPCFTSPGAIVVVQPTTIVRHPARTFSCAGVDRVASSCVRLVGGLVAAVRLFERTKSVADAADRLERRGAVAHLLSQPADDRLDDVRACAVHWCPHTSRSSSSRVTAMPSRRCR